MTHKDKDDVGWEDDEPLAHPDDVGREDELLNEKEVHIFCVKWKAGHPELVNDRVVLEIKTTPEEAIWLFRAGQVKLFVEKEQYYICRYIKNGQEIAHHLIAP